jgi:hypothetical protein
MPAKQDARPAMHAISTKIKKKFVAPLPATKH